MKFELGMILKDKITGFQGVAMAHTEYLTECVHYGICSQSLQNGKPIEWEWFDEARLILVNDEKIEKESRRATESQGGVQ